MAKLRRQHGKMAKAPLTMESAGKNPADRGKMGTKRSVLTDENGLPLAVFLSGADTHDVKLLGVTLDNLVIEYPKTSGGKRQNLCMDAGYTGHQDEVERGSYTAHIRPRGEETKELEHNPRFHARRWGVEMLHFLMNRFRKLLVRYEKKAVNSLALVYFACSDIVWRKIIPVYQQFWDKL